MGTHTSGLRLGGRLTSAAVALAAVICAAPAAANPRGGFVVPQDEPPAISVAANPRLTYHGGPILTQTSVKAIFWGRSWNNPAFVGDKVGGIDSFYGGVGGTPYMKSNIEYTGFNGRVGAGVSYGGHLVDTTAAKRSGADNPGVILNEVARLISSPVSNGYYPVYTDLPRGSHRFCAWHSYGNVGGVVVQFGFFFKLDGDAACDPSDPSSTHSQGLEALANVSGHELSETVTDPHIDAWLDNAGFENSDKCAWSFAGSVPFSNGTSWRIQGNWSNIAFDHGSGFRNRNGQRACLVTQA